MVNKNYSISRASKKANNILKNYEFLKERAGKSTAIILMRLMLDDEKINTTPIW
jgi:hypothetical protein